MSISIGCPAVERNDLAARGLRGLVFAVGLLLALGIPSAAFANEKPKLLLLPVIVHSSESPDYLRAGLADMLASRFIQAGNFEVVLLDDPTKATTRIPAALAIAREEGADFVLFGSFTRFGEGASLDMQAAATAQGEDGETLREIFVHSGSIGEVIPDLKDLVGKVTRFAIPEYTPAPAAVAPGAAQVGRRDDNTAELKRRIAALEQAVRTLEQSSGAKSR